MTSFKYILIGFALGTITLYGCQKITAPPVQIAPPSVAQVQEQPAPNVVAAVPHVVTPASTPAAKLVFKPSVFETHKAKAKAAAKPKAGSEETSATEKAEMNAQLAECLSGLVDFKIQLDVQKGSIAEFPSILAVPGGAMSPPNESGDVGKCYAYVYQGK